MGDTCNYMSDEVAVGAVILTSKASDIGQVITIPTETDTIVMTTGEVDLGQILTIPTDVKKEEPAIDPHLVYVLSQEGTEIQEGAKTSPLSFVAVVQSSSHHELTGDADASLVAMVPDSTHHAPPISCQDDDSTLTLKEITAREKSRIIKKTQRQNTDFREKERVKNGEKMKDKRKDPAYREMERQRDRERRRLSRRTNNSLREKERERDREYRRRLKTTEIRTKNSHYFECLMDDIEDNCQLLINCKQDDSSEEISYNFHGKVDFDEEIHSAANIDHNESSDLIGQYEDNMLQSDIISEKYLNNSQCERTELISHCDNITPLESNLEKASNTKPFKDDMFHSEGKQSSIKNVFESTDISYIL